jgi:hypothetical protein
MTENNGAIRCERHGGTLLVYVPAVKWYQFGVPYSSELERILRPATHDEERAIVIAPDRTTLRFLKMESYPAQIQITLDEKEARRLAGLSRYTSQRGDELNGTNGHYSNGSLNSRNGHMHNGNGLPESPED